MLPHVPGHYQVTWHILHVGVLGKTKHTDAELGALSSRQISAAFLFPLLSSYRIHLAKLLSVCTETQCGVLFDGTHANLATACPYCQVLEESEQVPESMGSVTGNKSGKSHRSGEMSIIKYRRCL